MKANILEQKLNTAAQNSITQRQRVGFSSQTMILNKYSLVRGGSEAALRTEPSPFLYYSETESH